MTSRGPFQSEWIYTQQSLLHVHPRHGGVYIQVQRWVRISPHCALAGLFPSCAIVSSSRYYGILSATLTYWMFCCIWHHTPVLVVVVPMASVSWLVRRHRLQMAVLYFHIKAGTTLLQKYWHMEESLWTMPAIIEALSLYYRARNWAGVVEPICGYKP